MLLHLFIAALWSPAGKGLTSKLLLVMFNCVFVTFPCVILGQVWCLIVSIPDLCRLSYFLLKPQIYVLYSGPTLLEVPCLRKSSNSCILSGDFVMV